MEQLKEKIRLPFARNVDSHILAELFFVNAILSIVLIRTFLYLTGYPQIGGDVLHIAHMLWGGLLMALSLFILLFFVGRTRLFIAAIVGGLGFGTFIDELGKFITADNDYFFQPTFAIIYLLFVCMFFLFRVIFIKKPLSPKEYLINAAEFVTEMVVSEDYDSQDAIALHSLLEKSGADESIKQDFLRMAMTFETKRATKQNIYARLKQSFRQNYTNLVDKHWFGRLITLFFVARGILVVLGVLATIYIAVYSPEATTENIFNFFDLGLIISSGIANILLIIGLLKYHGNKLDGLRWFRASTLVSILLYSFFSFYFNQLTALFGLTFDVLVLYALEIMISEEREKTTSDNK